MEFFTLVKWLQLKRLKISRAGEDVKKMESLHTLGGNVSCYNYYGK
jgi:hypothetical protein